LKILAGLARYHARRILAGVAYNLYKENGDLAKLKRPLYIFTGLQFEPIEPVDADVIVVGDCAKPALERFPNAQYWGSCEEFPNCTPIWANIPERSISTYIRRLTELSR